MPLRMVTVEFMRGNHRKSNHAATAYSFAHALFCRNITYVQIKGQKILLLL